MQVKTTIRNHLASVRMTTIRKPTKNKCWRLCEKKKKGTLYTTGRNVYLYSDYGEQSGGAVKKTKNRAII